MIVILGYDQGEGDNRLMTFSRMSRFFIDVEIEDPDQPLESDKFNQIFPIEWTDSFIYNDKIKLLIDDMDEHPKDSWEKFRELNVNKNLNQIIENIKKFNFYIYSYKVLHVTNLKQIPDIFNTIGEICTYYYC